MSIILLIVHCNCLLEKLHHQAKDTQRRTGPKTFFFEAILLRTRHFIVKTTESELFYKCRHLRTFYVHRYYVGIYFKKYCIEMRHRSDSTFPLYRVQTQGKPIRPFAFHADCRIGLIRTLASQRPQLINIS